ncbi:MAG: right-handed parallel beta-helix repeat-containing protein [Mucilaginibacter sp.]
MKKLLIGLVIAFCAVGIAQAKNYYFHPESGDDNNNGTSITSPFKNLKKLKALSLNPGDSVLLAGGFTFNGSLILQNIHGSSQKNIVISSYTINNKNELSKIDAKGFANAILLEDCSFIEVRDLSVTANGGNKEIDGNMADMRCGVLVKSTKAGLYAGISLTDLKIKDIFYEDQGFVRGGDDVKTANGTQKYGWGIRIMNKADSAYFENIRIEGCEVSSVSHTGINLVGKKGSIRNVKLLNNKVTDTGGPGMQMSGVKTGWISGNYINGSGSKKDTRNWSRGSGLWTWSTSDVLIEKNYFLNANGPGDSAGCHIDFNCTNVIIQYNLSANNAGGFCEILGNNHNCAYRYNISVNDGYRTKGVDGAFQEGKTFWLSGYVGNKVKPQGPFNTYFYNNTIYTKKDISVKIAIATSAEGILMANNIFYIEGESKLVAGDQQKFEKTAPVNIERCFFKNNLFLKASNWPKAAIIQDDEPIIGDALFKNKGGLKLEDYVPTNVSLIKNKGIEINKIEGDQIGLVPGLKVEYDILGNKITGKPDLGAIEIK